MPRLIHYEVATTTTVHNGAGEGVGGGGGHNYGVAPTLVSSRAVIIVMAS